MRRPWIIAVIAAALAIFATAVGIFSDFSTAYEKIGIIGLLALFLVILGLALLLHRNLRPEQLELAQGPEQPQLPQERGKPQEPYRRRRIIGGSGLIVAGAALLGLRLPVWNGGDMQTPLFVSSSSASTNGQSILSFTIPMGIQADDILIAQVHGRGREPISPPPDWTPIKGIESGDNMQSFWKRASGAEPSRFDFSMQNLNGKGGGITVWRGIDVEDPIADTSMQAVKEKRQLVLPSILAAKPNSPLILMVGTIGSTQITAPADMVPAWTEVSPAGEFTSTTICATGVTASVMGSSSPSGEKLVEAGVDGFGGSIALLIALRPVAI